MKNGVLRGIETGKYPAPVYGLFRRALQKNDAVQIARTLGLHPNTIARWRERRFVPAHYSHDFLRLLGEPARTNGGARDRDQFYTRPRNGALLHSQNVRRCPFITRRFVRPSFY